MSIWPEIWSKTELTKRDLLCQEELLKNPNFMKILQRQQFLGECGRIGSRELGMSFWFGECVFVASWGFDVSVDM